MTDHAAMCLQKTWPVIVRLVVEIACRVSLSLPMRRADRLASLRLLRLAESLMRRWLVLTACQRPLQMRVVDQLRPDAASDAWAQALSEARHDRLFQLADPVCDTRLSAAFTLIPGEAQALIAFDLAAAEPTGSRAALPEPDLCDPRLQAHLWQRSQALIGVMQAPERHVRRMRRRLRQAHRRAPLRAGRVPGDNRSMRRRQPDRQAALRDLSAFSRQALSRPVSQRGPPDAPRSSAHTLY